MRRTWTAIVMVLGSWSGSAPAQDFSGADPAPPTRVERRTPLPVTGLCSPAPNCPSADDLLAAARDWDVRETAAIERALDNDGTLHMSYQLVNRIRAVHCGSLVGKDPPRVNCRMTRLYRGRLPNYIRAELVRDRGIWRIRQVVPDLRYSLGQ